MDQVAHFPRFWMCLRLVNGVASGAPTHRHASEIDARHEAERLARCYGGTVIVLEAIAEVKRADVIWTNLEAQPPF